MNKKIIIIFGILFLMLVISIAIPTSSETNEKGLFGRVHIRAIGRNFHICEDDGGVYGHIFLGLKGFKIIFNEDIVIPEENIRWIVMTRHTLNCVYKES